MSAHDDTIRLRPLTRADTTTFRNLRLLALKESPTAFGSHYDDAVAMSLEEFASRIREQPDDFLLGAFADGGLIGMAGFMREGGRKQAHKATIWGMYVHPAHRGAGLGRRLLGTLIEHARTVTDIEQIHLSVTRGNEAATNLYLSLGFSVYGVEPRALRIDGDYHDEAHMVLLLAND
ncbi:MAG: GNAT family N-acetyltransferase [Pseudomonadales bacterium]